MINDPFHQIISVVLDIGRRCSSGEINRIMKQSGASLHYDVYSFERADKGPVWQSESFIYVSLFCNESEVDAQESVDKIEFQYPMATIGSEYIQKFSDAVFAVADVLGCNVLLDGKVVNRQELIAHCDAVATDIMNCWGEEPGSKNLRILIEQNYG